MQLRTCHALVPLLALVTAPAFADEGETVQARARVGSYGDDDATTVLSPRASVSATPGRGLRVAAGWAADVVTSASVDVTTSATRGWSETRHEVFGQASLVRGSAAGTLGAVHSRENDWISTGTSVAGRLELLQRTLTLGARWGLSLEQVGRAGDPAFSRDLTVHTVEAGLAQVLSPRAIGSIGASLRIAEGFQQSVYRFVPISHGYQVLPEPTEPGCAP
jgi:hypothetical protein